MKRPNETDASVSHLRFSSAKIRALMQPQTSQRESRDFTWTPSAEQLDAANVGRLARSLGCSTYDELHRVSVDEPDRFWRSVVDDLGIPLARAWDEVLDEFARHRVDDVVPRRAAEHRGGLRAPVGA